MCRMHVSLLWTVRHRYPNTAYEQWFRGHPKTRTSGEIFSRQFTYRTEESHDKSVSQPTPLVELRMSTIPPAATGAFAEGFCGGTPLNRMANSSGWDTVGTISWELLPVLPSIQISQSRWTNKSFYRIIVSPNSRHGKELVLTR